MCSQQVWYDVTMLLYSGFDVDCCPAITDSCQYKITGQLLGGVIIQQQHKHICVISYHSDAVNACWCQMDSLLDDNNVGLFICFTKIVSICQLSITYLDRSGIRSWYHQGVSILWQHIWMVSEVGTYEFDELSPICCDR